MYKIIYSHIKSGGSQDKTKKIKIIGDPIQGSTLTTELVNLTKDDIISYQWSSKDKNATKFEYINNENNSEFTIPDNYSGKYIRVTVTYREKDSNKEKSISSEVLEILNNLKFELSKRHDVFRTNYESESESESESDSDSEDDDKIEIQIDGDPIEGSTLTTKLVKKKNKVKIIKYQWLLKKKNATKFEDIIGENNQEFTIPDNYGGNLIKVTVTYEENFGKKKREYNISSNTKMIKKKKQERQNQNTNKGKFRSNLFDINFSKKKKEKEKKKEIDIEKLKLIKTGKSLSLKDEDDDESFPEDIPFKFVAVSIFDKELIINYSSKKTSYNYDYELSIFNNIKLKYLINQNNEILKLGRIDDFTNKINTHINEIKNPKKKDNKIGERNILKKIDQIQKKQDREESNNESFKKTLLSLKKYNFNNKITSQAENIEEIENESIIQNLVEIKKSLNEFKNYFDLASIEDNHKLIITSIKSVNKENFIFKGKNLKKNEVLNEFEMYLKIKSFLYLLIYNNKHFSYILNIDPNIDYEKIKINILDLLKSKVDINGCWIYKNDSNQIDIQKKSNNDNQTSEIQPNDTDFNQNKSKEIESKEEINYKNFRLLIFFKDILSRQDINNINFILN